MPASAVVMTAPPSETVLRFSWYRRYSRQIESSSIEMLNLWTHAEAGGVTLAAANVVNTLETDSVVIRRGINDALSICVSWLHRGDFVGL
jgi:hypothetical protein